MNSLIFNLPSSNLYFPSTNLDFQGSNLVNFEVPTSRAPTLYLVQAPTQFLEDFDPLGLQPYPPRHQPCIFEAPTLSFTSSRYIWLYFTAPNVFFNESCPSSVILHFSLHLSSSMTTLISLKVSPLLFIILKLDLQGHLMMTFNNASWSSRFTPSLYCSSLQFLDQAAGPLHLQMLLPIDQ